MTGSNSASNLLILDSTLREGEQAASIILRKEQKIALAKELSEFGVNFIEISPIVSSEQKEIAKELNSMELNAEIISHLRARPQDIDIALECNSTWVALFLSTSEIHLQSKLKINKEIALERATKAINYAKDHGLKVRFTCEDSSRTDIEYLKKMCSAVSDAKVDRISITDTIGSLNPKRTRELIGEIKSITTTPLDAHLHNDLGLALANALSAYEAGVSCIHTTINGVGERIGIVKLAELVVALEYFYGEKVSVKKEMLTKLSEMFSNYSNSTLDPFSPIVGKNAFRHKGGTHLPAMIRNNQSYEVINPKSVGNKRSFVLGEYSGKGLMKYLSTNLGMDLTDEQIAREIVKIKQKKGDMFEFGE